MRSFQIVGVALLLGGLLSGQSFGNDTSAFLERTPPIRAWDLDASASALETSGDGEALVKAIILRRGLAQSEPAVRDLKRFIATLADPTLFSERAANLFLEDVLGQVPWPETEQWESALRQFLERLPRRAAPAARLRAEVFLAAHLWRKSCPVPGDDDACIHRIDVKKEYRELLHETRTPQEKSPPKRLDSFGPCYTPASFRYEVFSRRSSLAREAQQLAALAIEHAHALPTFPKAGDPLDDALAHALFLQAELHFEAMLKDRLWTALLPQKEFSSRRIKKWLSRRLRGPRGRMISLVKLPEQSLYARVLEHPGSRWSAAAHARISQLLLDMDDQLYHAPIKWFHPPVPRGSGLSREQWVSLFKEAICEPNDELPQVDQALSACDAESTHLLLDDPYARFCREAISSRRPASFHEVLEIHVQPRFEVVVNPAAVQLLWTAM